MVNSQFKMFGKQSFIQFRFRTMHGTHCTHRQSLASSACVHRRLSHRLISLAAALALAPGARSIHAPSPRGGAAPRRDSPRIFPRLLDFPPPPGGAQRGSTLEAPPRLSKSIPSAVWSSFVINGSYTTAGVLTPCVEPAVAFRFGDGARYGTGMRDVVRRNLPTVPPRRRL